MENLHKKVIWNAISAYFMIWVCIFFLFNKGEYFDHPFVKSHVKVAFSLHLIRFFMLFVMSYPFLDNIDILGYSHNTLMTAVLSLFLFWAILYGMLQAHRWNTMTVSEIFHKAWVSKNVMKHESTETLGEQETVLLILAQIPFLGYIIYPRHKKIPHIRDVSQLNLLVTIISCLLLLIGYNSLASLVMLLYIIMAVFQWIRLGMENKISTLDMSLIPTAEEKYITLRALLKYIGNTFRKDTFTPLKEIRATKTTLAYEREKSELTSIKNLDPAKIPTWIFYIPLINLIWVFFFKTQDNIHIKNGLVITMIFWVLFGLFGWDSPTLIFMLFPIFYWIGYVQRKAYHMPYMYDVYALLGKIFWTLWHIFLRTRKLQKTDVSKSIKMNEIKKES